MTQTLPAGCSIVTAPVHSDPRGSLVPLESATGVPFEIKRAFYIFEVPAGVARGFHAHREVEELLVCVTGACTVTVDNGRERADVRLDSPTRALVMGSMVWNEMRDFTPGAVLLVLASAPYVESGYIHDYDRFRELVTA